MLRLRDSHHVLELDPAAPAGEIAAPAPAKFAALRNTVGIHWSLGLSSVALCLGTLAAGIYALRDRPAAAEAQAPTP